MTDTIATYLMMLLRMSIQIQTQGKHLAEFNYWENLGRVSVRVLSNGAGTVHEGKALSIDISGVVHIRSTARIGEIDPESRTYPSTEAGVIACLERAATELKAYVDGSISDPIQEARHAA
ncbi:hypothetical protein [Halopseudomonas salina]|uniref:Uncharacterized protein n=1 Tax=Halopseudomonas salina TaxID=1323744 RepID=A0ABQ1NXK8_9GAMM|nr:hypothetical protein [Halopseudomonas salina]GGC87213.1 hypothetical protein GCM10007418_03740 [Halopseudomonas salina]